MTDRRRSPWPEIAAMAWIVVLAVVAIFMAILLSAEKAHSESPLGWTVQVTVCPAGPLLSGWDKSCRTRLIRCADIDICRIAYSGLIGPGEVARRVIFTSPEQR